MGKRVGRLTLENVGLEMGDRAHFRENYVMGSL